MSQAERNPLRVVFMGTPDFAVPAARALHADPRFEVVRVVSQPSRRSGRGKRLTPPPVAAWALEADIPLLQVQAVREDDIIQELKADEPDFLVVIAFGQILPQQLLDIAAIAPINVHASLLPRWRGAAPIQRAIEAGDSESGLDIMRMEAGLDTGPVYAREVVSITDTMTGGELHDLLAERGADLLPNTLVKIAEGLTPTSQSEDGVTWAAKLGRADRKLNWSLDAQSIANKINAMSPWPGIRTQVGGAALHLLQARLSPLKPSVPDAPAGCVIEATHRTGLHITGGDGRCVEILELHRPGKRAMSAAEWLCGNQLQLGVKCQ